MVLARSRNSTRKCDFKFGKDKLFDFGFLVRIDIYISKEFGSDQSYFLYEFVGLVMVLAL